VMPEPPAGHPDHGDWAYGVGKRAGEDALAAAFARDGFPSTRLRVPVINGERDHTRRLEGYLWRLSTGARAAAGRRHPSPAPRVRAGRLAPIAGLLGQPAPSARPTTSARRRRPPWPSSWRCWPSTWDGAAACAGARAAIEAAGLDPVRVSPFSGRWMSMLDPGRARAELGFAPTPLATTSAPSRPASWPIRPPPRPTPTPTGRGSWPWPGTPLQLTPDRRYPVN
jgi:hypothetical protein